MSWVHKDYPIIHIKGMDSNDLSTNLLPQSQIIQISNSELLACNDVTEFSQLVTTKFGVLGDGITVNNIENSTFNKGDGVGISVRYGNTTGDPIFTISQTKIPKRISFSFSLNVVYMTSCILKATTTSGEYALFSIIDGHYSTAGGSGYDGVSIDNNTSKIYTWGPGATGTVNYTVELNIPADTPNCFTSGESICDLSYYCAVSYSSYSTQPLYIKDFTMEF